MNSFSICSIFRFTDGQEFRVIAIQDNTCVLCEMNCSRLNLLCYDLQSALNDINDGMITVIADEPLLFEKSALSEKTLKKYEYMKSIIDAVSLAYGPTYLDLMGRNEKIGLKKILSDADCSRQVFWKYMIKYLQSGMKEISLVDTKAFGLNKGKTYQYSSKPGRKSEFFTEIGIVVDDTVLSHFQEALNYYFSARPIKLTDAYDFMKRKYYTRTDISNGVAIQVFLPENEIPTYKQFYDYYRKNTTKEQLDIKKSSEREVRNNKRLIIGDELYDVHGAGDLAEIDAWESDIDLVAEYDRSVKIGRAVVYFLIDVFTKVILAMSVSYDNNSFLGITNLFLNLLDDKATFCSRYGFTFENIKMIWPSNILPNRVRLDRGSEALCKGYERICNELNIQKDNVTGATGSLKGSVEQSFHQLNMSINSHVESFGLIEKRYDSNHRNESSMTIEEFTKVAINFVVTHNVSANSSYHLTKEMISSNISPKPAELWQFSVKKYGPPRPISDKAHFLWSLMSEEKATLSRKGIEWKDLIYLPRDDSELLKRCYEAGNKKVPFTVRMDKRHVGTVYYIQNNRLMSAELNSLMVSNQGYENMSAKEYLDYRKEKKKQAALDKVRNENVRLARQIINADIVAEAKKQATDNLDTKNVRAHKERQKQLTDKECYAISDRLPKDENPHITAPKKELIPAKLEQEGTCAVHSFDEFQDEW